MDTPSAFARRSLAATTASGWIGAISWGIGDLLRLAIASRLAPGPAAWVVLVLLTVLGTGGIGLVAGAVLGLATGGRCGRFGAWIASFALCGWLSFALYWLARPTPLTPGGNPVVVAIAGFVLGGAAIAAWWGRRRRPEVGPALILGLAAAFVAQAALVHSRLPSPAARTGPRPPSVLLVTLDTTRADRFGSHPIDTGAFDRIASEGARFEQAMSPIAVTAGAHATILTGLQPWQHEVLLNGREMPADPTLAEILSRQGYATAAFPSAYVLDGRLGFARGFTTYDDDFSLVQGTGRLLVGKLWQAWRRHGDEGLVLERRADETVDAALSWLKHQDGPFLLWVHLYDPHGPYTPPPPYDERYYRGVDPRNPLNHSLVGVGPLPPYLQDTLRGITDRAWVIAQYDGEVAYADEQVRRLLGWLDDSGRTDDTIVIAVGDHGEGLGEEGELFTHGDHLYEHDLHVPLAVRWPGRITAGTVVRWPVGLADVTPTILDLLELPAPGRATGASLVPAMAEDARPHVTVDAMCLDRDANRALREQDPAAPPRYRLVSVRTPEDRLVLRESDGTTRWWVRGVEVTTPADARQAEVRALLERQARGLLDKGGAVSDSQQDLELLRRLGYIEP